MIETRYQRVAREQRERQAIQAAKREAEYKASAKRARQERAVRKERRYLAILASDHDHSMDA